MARTQGARPCLRLWRCPPRRWRRGRGLWCCRRWWGEERRFAARGATAETRRQGHRAVTASGPTPATRKVGAAARTGAVCGARRERGRRRRNGGFGGVNRTARRRGGTGCGLRRAAGTGIRRAAARAEEEALELRKKHELIGLLSCVHIPRVCAR